MSVNANVACSSGVNFARSCFELNALLSMGGEGRKGGEGRGGRKGGEGRGGRKGGEGRGGRKGGEGRGGRGAGRGEGRGRGTMQLIENHPGKQ